MPNCEICSASDWSEIYSGYVRDGAFGNLSAPTTVDRCASCGADRLAESACKEVDFYEGEKYRLSLNESTDTMGYMRQHDVMQIENLKAFWPISLRGLTVADVGCGAGSFLDHVSGVAKNIIAIEPCRSYHSSLRDRGYRVFSYAHDIVPEIRGSVDFAFSFSVIEHVANPRDFLASISQVIGPAGYVLISTPNRADALMELGGEEYRQFFYRVAHRWYFDRQALENCGRLAGLEMVETRYVQRFGISNALAWLRDKRPSGNTPIERMDGPALNAQWKTHLEESGISDYMYLLFKKRA